MSPRRPDRIFSHHLETIQTSFKKTSLFGLKGREVQAHKLSLIQDPLQDEMTLGPSKIWVINYDHTGLPTRLLKTPESTT